jgi:hypothetical protein
MRKRRFLVTLAAVVAGIGMLSAPAADASPASDITRTSTRVVAWVHQCAAMYCGYHEVPAGQPAFTYCAATTDENFWNLIVTKSPWNSSLTIAGYVSTDALVAPISSPRCGGFFGTPANMDYWAHSCPVMSCGYGVIHQGDIYHDLDYVTAPGGRVWRLVVDLSSRDLLAGYVYP